MRSRHFLWVDLFALLVSDCTSHNEVRFLLKNVQYIPRGDEMDDYHCS